MDMPRIIASEDDAVEAVNMIKRTCFETERLAYFAHIDFDCSLCPCSVISGSGEWVCRFGIGNGTNLHITWNDLPFFEDVEE